VYTRLLRIVRGRGADHRLCRFSAIKVFVPRNNTHQVHTNEELSTKINESMMNSRRFGMLLLIPRLNVGTTLPCQRNSSPFHICQRNSKSLKPQNQLISIFEQLAASRWTFKARIHCENGLFLSRKSTNRGKYQQSESVFVSNHNNYQHPVGQTSGYTKPSLKNEHYKSPKTVRYNKKNFNVALKNLALDRNRN